MYKKNAKWLVIGILAVIILAMMSGSLGKYTENLNTNVTLNIRKPAYTVRFHPNNDGADNYLDQSFTYGTAQNLTANSFSNGSLSFLNWSTEIDGSGTTYTDEQEVNNLSQTDGTIIDLYAQWGDELYEAEVVGDKKYSTVAEAISAVTANSGQHTIKLLKNVVISDALEIADGKNIIFNLQNYTIKNATGTDINIISNNGTLEIIGNANGKIESSAAHGAVDNNHTGSLVVRSGNIIAIGERQAIYNSGGTLEITGTAYLSSSAPDRPAVQNAKPSGRNAGTITISGGTIISTNTTTKGAIENDNTGTVIITGGTITSQNQPGVNNRGTLIIGEEGGNIDATSPVIQGATYGVNTTTSTVEFYDGIVKGVTHAFNNEDRISGIEDHCAITHSSEVIDGDTYETAYLETTSVRLVFDANGGTPAQTIVYVEPNTAIGTNMPQDPTKECYRFDGWFTDPTGGTQVTNATVASANDTYYAHWTKVKALVIFNAGEGGTSSEDEREVNIGATIGTLPTATKQYNTFVGWFTDPTNGTQITTSQVINDDVTYFAHWDPIIATVTLDPRDGTIPVTTGWTIDQQTGMASKTLEAGNTVGTLPTPTRTAYNFTGWYTAATGGTRINNSQLVTGTATYYAQWTDNAAAIIGQTLYATLQEAIDDVPTDNTETTITLLKDTLEAVYVAPDKNIVLDLDGHKLYNNGTKNAKSMNDNSTRPSVIENLGSIKIKNGIINASSRQSAINTATGTIIIENASVTHTGEGTNNTKQAIYLYSGTLIISGNSTISANNAGSYQGVNRGVIQTDAGTVKILGGTVTSTAGPAITTKAAGKIELGEKDGTIGNTSPVIQGKTNGIETPGTLKFYDGIVKGKTAAISGTVSDTETGATEVNGTETIGSDIYYTRCYQ